VIVTHYISVGDHLVWCFYQNPGIGTLFPTNCLFPNPGNDEKNGKEIRKKNIKFVIDPARKLRTQTDLLSDLNIS
jgi:hypothetical protein